MLTKEGYNSVPLVSTQIAFIFFCKFVFVELNMREVAVGTIQPLWLWLTFLLSSDVF